MESTKIAREGVRLSNVVRIRLGSEAANKKTKRLVLLEHLYI